jgi:putative transposase
VKTIEFKTRLNQQQINQTDEWFRGLRRLWNLALAILEDNQQWYWRTRNNLSDDPYPISWRWAANTIRIEINGTVEEETIFGLCCDITAPQNNHYGKRDQLFPSSCRDYRPACPIKRSPGSHSPLLLIQSKDPYISLTKYFAHKNHPDKPWLKAIPCEIIRGTLKSLAKAWQEYRNHKREKPKFKSKNKPLKTLISNDLKGIPIKDNRVRFPLLGWLTCKTLAERWSAEVRVSTIKLCKRPSGYYVQLTGDVPTNWQAKASDKACGIDVGLQYLYTDDIGKTVEPPHYYRKIEKQLKRLQRKLDRQLFDFEVKTVNGKETAIKYRRSFDSNNAQKTRKRIARLHEQIANQRRSFNQKLSTYIVRKFGGIAVEDIKITNLNRRPKPIEREEGFGQWEHNKAAIKSGLNKSFADAAIGQFITFTEHKAGEHNREFIKVPAAYTSQECPNCGHCQPKALSQRTHHCQNCGYTTKRDHAAAENIKAKAQFQRKYRGSARKFKPVESSSVETMKQEREQSRLHSDAVASVKSSFNRIIGNQLELNLFPETKKLSDGTSS